MTDEEDLWRHIPAQWTFPDDTPARVAAHQLADRILASKDPNAGGVRTIRDDQTVIVCWKGPPPDGLRRLAAQQPVPVAFETVPYGVDELMAIAEQLVTDHRAVSSAGPAKNYSGVGVTLWSKTPIDPETVVAALSEEVGVPVYFERYADPVPLGG
ncbi:hypothetical protein ACIA49_24265 [Kribbella sp. NPDC051587]|uniref:hypothetical protein n=1 Tax=Kribbella sp. NPDC051587 TaxID=3364119 RepID=UPI0037AB8B15